MAVPPATYCMLWEFSCPLKILLLGGIILVMPIYSRKFGKQKKIIVILPFSGNYCYNSF